MSWWIVGCGSCPTFLYTLVLVRPKFKGMWLIFRGRGNRCRRGQGHGHQQGHDSSKSQGSSSPLYMVQSGVYRPCTSNRTYNVPLSEKGSWGTCPYRVCQFFGGSSHTYHNYPLRFDHAYVITNIPDSFYALNVSEWVNLT